MSVLDLASRAADLQLALHSLERGLEEARTQWDDEARHLFDRMRAEPVVFEARRQVNELTDAAGELAAAVRILKSL